MKLQKLRHLPGRDRVALLNAWIVLWLVRFGLWLMPFSWLRKCVSVGGRVRRARVGREDDVQRLAWAVRVASRFVPGATCLPQALTLQALLTRSGIPSEVRFGFARDAKGVLQGHAWVVNDGRTLIGGNVEGFEELDGIELVATSPPGVPASPSGSRRTLEPTSGRVHVDADHRSRAS